MRLILREYLSSLRERHELDALLADLLPSMGLQLLSRPQQGVRQFGVDVAATGPDPGNGKMTLFLFTVKPGDFDRVAWDGGSLQAVRSSLNEILDVYLVSHVSAEHQGLPKRIILCYGGDLKQDVQPNWAQYTRRHSGRSLKLDAWGGDQLAALLEANLLNENLFTEAARKSMRKALVLLDLPEYQLSHFADLLEEVLFRSKVASESKRAAVSLKQYSKAMRLVNLSLNIIFRWASDADNLRPAYLAGELAVLHAWDGMRRHNIHDKREIFQEFMKIYQSFRMITASFIGKVRPACKVRDGLFGYGPWEAEEVEYPIRFFEIIGILGLAGLDYVRLAPLDESGACEGVACSICDLIIDLINNNPGALAPAFDGHIIDIHLALLLLVALGRRQEAVDWLAEVMGRAALGFQMGRRFPIGTDSYEDLIALELGEVSKEDLVKVSWLLPSVAEWAVVLENPELYERVRSTAQILGVQDLQLWYPDAKTEEFLYTRYAASRSGTSEAPIILPDDFENFRRRIVQVRDLGLKADEFSAIAAGLPQIVLLASRHFRTPMPPFFWQSLCRAPV